MSRYAQEYYEKHFSHEKTNTDWLSVDKAGNSIPWITYSALFQLEQYDWTECDIFEWGAGHSTAFWSEKCSSITSVENDQEWYDFVKNKALKNVDLNLTTLDDYASFINRDDKKYDLIVVDGYIHEKMRFLCTEHATSHLKNGGMLILDNSDWLPNTCSFLRGQGFNQFDYSGLGPINNYPWCTSIFTQGVIEVPRKNISPGFVAGGIKNERD